MPRRSAFILTTAAALALSAVVVPQALGATTGCRVDYQIQSQWSNAFQANLTMVNLGDPITGWRLEFDLANQRLVNGWGANWRQEPGSPHVTADNLPWNAELATGRTMTIGFQATWSGTNTVPTSFKINGIACTGAIVTTGPSTPAATTPPATTRATTPPTTYPTVPAPVVRLQGVVRAGVEMGCMLLDTEANAPAYLLLGGDRTLIKPGARLVVYGRYAPGTISFCMQGVPFQVVGVQPL
jgi:hypothetical protein